MISGPPDTRTTLTILNPDTGGKRDVALVGSNIIVNNVTWSRLPARK